MLVHLFNNNFSIKTGKPDCKMVPVRIDKAVMRLITARMMDMCYHAREK